MILCRKVKLISAEILLSQEWIQCTHLVANIWDSIHRHEIWSGQCFALTYISLFIAKEMSGIISILQQPCVRNDGPMCFLATRRQ